MRSGTLRYGCTCPRGWETCPVHAAQKQPEDALTPGYYLVAFGTNRFARYWDGEKWHFAAGGRSTPLAITGHTVVERIEQP